LRYGSAGGASVAAQAFAQSWHNEILGREGGPPRNGQPEGMGPANINLPFRNRQPVPVVNYEGHDCYPSARSRSMIVRDTAS
jgi:hypothetical protein